jgi:hypothetical protein
MHDKPPPPEVVTASPPALKTPEDVLTMFADEIRSKYGDAAFDTIDLNLEIDARKKIEHGIIAKFKPHIVIGMIRVLVWDWEVIRETCWPHQPKVNYPRPEFLMVYRPAIASAVPTGFDYTGAIRGSHTSYAQRYLSDGKIIDDPF